MIAVQSSINLPGSDPEVREQLWSKYNAVDPHIDLTVVFVATGPRRLVTEAAIHLAQCNSEPTTLEGLSKDSLIDRLVELAQTCPLNRNVSPQDFNRARAAQSAALGILGRPIVPANESLLKRIPADVIHALMADLHHRIRKTDNRITVITTDGCDWVLKSGA